MNKLQLQLLSTSDDLPFPAATSNSNLIPVLLTTGRPKHCSLFSIRRRPLLRENACTSDNPLRQTLFQEILQHVVNFLSIIY
jgi:hypothetical protein